MKNKKKMQPPMMNRVLFNNAWTNNFPLFIMAGIF